MVEVFEIAPTVFRIAEELDGCLLCQYLLRGNERSLLIDAGLGSSPTRTLVPAFSAIGFDASDLDYVLITHADVDHCGGLGELQRMAPKCVAICGPGDREMIENVEVLIDGRYREFRHIYGVDQTPEFCEWVRAETDTGCIDCELSSVRLRLSADWACRVIPAAGHSPGHLAVFDERNGALIIGDAVLGKCTPDSDGFGAFAPTYRHVDQYRATIARLASVGAQTVLTAHHPVLRGEAIGAFWADSDLFCVELESALLDRVGEVSEGITTAGLIAVVAERVRSWPASADASLIYPVVGHLERLQLNGLIERLPGEPAKWVVSRAAR